MKFLYYGLIVLVALGWLMQPAPVNGAKSFLPASGTTSNFAKQVSAASVSVASVAQPPVLAVSVVQASVCQNQSVLNLNQPASCFTWVKSNQTAKAVKISVAYAQAATRVVALQTPVEIIGPSLSPINPIVPSIPALPLTVFALAISFELTRRGLLSQKKFMAEFIGSSFKYFSPLVLRC